jgi:hypothetical protein
MDPTNGDWRAALRCRDHTGVMPWRWCHLQGAGFAIDNPNAQRTCGCGQSFS